MGDEQSYPPTDGDRGEQTQETDESEVAAECVDPDAVDDDHLEELPDGSGCVEVWEHLAERRGDGE